MKLLRMLLAWPALGCLAAEPGLEATGAAEQFDCWQFELGNGDPLPIGLNTHARGGFDDRYLSYSAPREGAVRFDRDALGACLARVVEERLAAGSPVSFSKRFETAEDALAYLAVWPAYSAAHAEDATFVPFERSDRPTKAPEDLLYDWVLAQPEHSVDPVSLLTESLALNDGDVYGAIFTCYGLLVREARVLPIYAESGRGGQLADPDYDADAAFERMAVFFNQFIDIRGDLQERGPDFVGDHPGSTYRMWGVMVFELTVLPLPGVPLGTLEAEASAPSATDILAASIQASGVSQYDEILKGSCERDAAGKRRIDAASAAALATALRAWFVRPLSDEARAIDCEDPEQYLVPAD